MLFTKMTAAQNVAAHSYHKVRGLYFLAVIFAAIILKLLLKFLVDPFVLNYMTVQNLPLLLLLRVVDSCNCIAYTNTK